MRSKPISTYVPYGAFELKRSYRKNLMIGNLIAGAVIFLLVIMIPPIASVPQLFADDSPKCPWPPEPIRDYNSVIWVFAGEDDTVEAEDSLSRAEQIPAWDEFVPFDIPPVLLEAPDPGYPEKAREAGVEGVVWLRVLIDKEGKVSDVMILKESGTSVGFEESALEAAKKRQYRPALQNNQPVAVRVAYKVAFKLQQDSQK